MNKYRGHGTFRWLICKLLLRLAYWVDETPFYVMEDLAHRIEWDAFEWAHDRDVDYTSNTYKVADRQMKKFDDYAKTAREIFEDYTFIYYTRWGSDGHTTPLSRLSKRIRDWKDDHLG
jgi:hypothetical protein